MIKLKAGTDSSDRGFSIGCGSGPSAAKEIRVPSIVGISGSASGSSKTLTVVDIVLRRITERVPAETQLISIAELAPDLGISSREAASPRIEAVLRQIETANLIIAASPVYKGAYTGLFKHLIDLIDYRALLGVPVGLIALGGSEKHALVVEHQLRPLFGFFSAGPCRRRVHHRPLRQ